MSSNPPNLQNSVEVSHLETFILKAAYESLSIPDINPGGRVGNQFSYQHQGKVYAEACASDVLHTRLRMKQVCVWIWGCLREMGCDVSRLV